MSDRQTQSSALKAVSAVVLTSLLAVCLFGQSQSSPTVSSAAVKRIFEIASIKRNTSQGRPQGLTAQPGGRVTASNVPLRLLIAPAYLLRPAQIQTISGAPDWMDAARFDLEAKADGNFTEQELSSMLQALLAERFKFKAHFESRQLPVYALVLVRPGQLGPQLIPHTETSDCIADPRGGGQPSSSNSHIPLAPCDGIRFLMAGERVGIGAHLTMERLAAQLAGAGREVVDHTGLTGVFDISLEYTRGLGQPGSLPDGGMNPSDPNGPPDVFTAVREQLGLKLEPQTGSVDVLVIDHVEQPSEN